MAHPTLPKLARKSHSPATACSRKPPASESGEGSGPGGQALHRLRPARCWPRLAAALIAWSVGGTVLGAPSPGFSIQAPRVDPDGRFSVQVAGGTGAYSVLYRGSALDAIQDPVALSTEIGAVVTLRDPGAAGDAPSRFYRVEQLLTLFPTDLDGDGIHDVLELRYPRVLDPFNASDADTDFDQDGRSNREEAVTGTDPTVADFALTRVSSLPAHGETGVSVHREVVWRFSETLAADAAVEPDVLHAELGSRRLLTRSQLSADRRKATLFLLEPAPPGARIRVRLDGSRLRDIHGNAVDGDGDGVAGGWAEIRYDTMNTTAVPGTGVSGYVFDSESDAGPNGPQNRPLAGVTLTVDGQEQVLRAVTDENGFFLLSPSPVGRFFVHIDGRTAVGSAWPDGAYYPVVGKTFEATVGQTNTQPGGTPAVYLPRVPAGALKPVSAVADTVIRLPDSVLAARPELAGLQITVPANALVADDGARGGRVGLAPVPRDRLPSPLPPGLEPPLVVTVQSDGASNFDAPVPVRFPNLPDPQTGDRPGPGEKTILWSFNHDSGKWEPQGTMTITADGQFADTDPGVGILQPGWHGARAVGQPAPPPPPGCNQWMKVGALFLEWQLKQAECAYRTLAVAGTLTGSPAGPGLNALVAAGAAVPGLASSLGSFAGAVQSGQNASILTSSLALLNSAAQAIGSTISAASATSLNSQIAGLVQCLLEMLRDQSEFACAAVPCILGPNTPGLARQQASCGVIQGALTTALNAMAAYNFTGANAMSRLLIALDRMTALVTTLAGNTAPQGSPLQRRSTPEEIREQLLREAEAAAAATRELQSELETAIVLDQSLESFSAAYSNYLADVSGPMLFRLSAHQNGWFALRSAGVTTRGRSTALGRFETPFVNLDEPYEFAIYDPARNTVSEVEAPAPGFGSTPVIPDPVLRVPGINDASGDRDGDGLTDRAEEVIGTAADQRDTDGDGASDWTEVQSGQNPLDGLSFPLGPVAGLQLPGNAKAIVVSGTTAYLALGTAGIGIVDVSNPLQPILVGTLPLSGDSFALAHCSSAGTLAVLSFAPDDQIARGELSLLHRVDVSDPANPRAVQSQPLPALLVRERDGIFYVPVNDQIRMLDASSGQEIGWLGAGAMVSGLLVTESEIFVTSGNQLAIHERRLLDAPLLGRLTGDFDAAERTSPVPMVLDGGTLWMGTARGLLTVDVTDRAAPRQRNQPGPIPRAVRTLALNAARQAVALTTVGPNAVNAGGQTSVYNIADPDSTNRLALVLNGRSRTYDAVLHSGWLLLADSVAGLTVMNVLPPDSAGVAPSVAWDPGAVDVDPSLDGSQVIEGATIHFHPQVTDDVDVATVELLVDGQVTAITRSLPADLAAPMPLRSGGTDRVRITFRARDRAGREAETMAGELELLEDTAPAVSDAPVPGTTLVAFRNAPLTLHFSERLQPDLLTPSTVSLRWLGADGLPGGGDDTLIPLTFAQSAGGSVVLWPATTLVPGRHQLVLPSASVRDAAGNPLPEDLLLEVLAVDAAPGAVAWVSPNPGRFHDPGNWNVRRAPTQEDVVISMPGGTPAVTLDGGVVARTLVADGAFTVTRFGSLTVRDLGRITGGTTLEGGSLAVSAGGRLITGLRATGGRLTVSGDLETPGPVVLRSGVVVTLEGPDAQWRRPDGLDFRDCTFSVQNGAVAELPEVVDYDSEGDFSGLFPVGTTFQAHGPESRLRLPELRTARGPEELRFTGAPSLAFIAGDGGVVELPQVTALTGRVRIEASGQGRMDLPLLTRIEGPATPAFPASIVCGNGVVDAPQLGLTTACQVTLGSDGRLRCARLGIEEGFALQGAGVVMGDVEVHGMLSPGEPWGVLRIEGRVTFGTQGVFSPVVGSFAGPGSLESVQTAHLDGTLRPIRARGASLTSGDLLEVARFGGGLSGAFSTVDASQLGPGAVIEMVPGPDRLSIRVVSP
ncbi:MAG: Ig-like domain-containing protein [Verrucomicrobia bacterium]|nr:Ig-like domain-containing protein [Verrucomicrobiota bacterium]